MTEGQAMALKINVLWCNRFMLRQWLPLLWEKLTHMPSVSRSYGQLADKKLADKIPVYSKISKFSTS